MFDIFVVIVMVIAVVVGTYGDDEKKELRFFAAMIVGLVIVIAGGVLSGVLPTMGGMGEAAAAMGVIGTRKLSGMVTMFPVMGRGDLFDHMVERTPITFTDEYRGTHMEGIIQSISMEDGSGQSFNVVVQDGAHKVDVYYNTRTGHTAINTGTVPTVRTTKHTNRDLFNRIMDAAQAMHRTTFDNGNTLVLQTRKGTETYNRMTMEITYREN